MYLKQFIAVFLVISGACALELPCSRRNVTIQSGVNFRILVAPSQCGHVTVNDTEFKVEPNLEHLTPTNFKDKFTVMLMRPNPRDHNHFFLHWLISNITPYRNSLTANKTRTIFKNYAPLVAFDNATRYWLYVFKQNHNTGPINYGYGLSPSDLSAFSPDAWIKSHMPQIGSLVGGLEFNVKPGRAPIARNNTTNTSYPNNYPRPPPYNPNYPQPSHPAPMPHPPPHGGAGNTVIINNPPAYNPNFPPPPPPAHPYNPQPNVVHHVYEKKKKGKGAASSIVAMFPLIVGLALGATQL